MVKKIEGADAPAPEFAAVLNSASDVDDAADLVVSGKKPDEVVTEVIDPVAAWAEIPALVGQVLCMAMPELKETYNEKACRAWGESMHKLAQKRGWQTDGLPPEVSVACTSAMFVIPTILVIKVRQAAAKKAKEEAGQGSGASDGQAAAT